jgi:hypothetical protein
VRRILQRSDVSDVEEDGMPKRRSGRARRTEKQWAEILRRFESSGEGSRRFCRREGLALSSLQRWRQRLGAIPATKFVELVPTSSSEPAAASWFLEVSLPNGVSLRFRG